jgi:hypothetical protein
MKIYGKTQHRCSVVPDCHVITYKRIPLSKTLLTLITTISRESIMLVPMLALLLLIIIAWGLALCAAELKKISKYISQCRSRCARIR